MNKLVILGSGGHASVLVDILRESETIVGYVDVKPAECFHGIPYIGTDEELITHYPPSSVKLVNGIGSIGSLKQRHNLFSYFKEVGYTFEKVIHPSAIISNEVIVEEGVQVLAGAILQCHSHISANSIVNSGSIVEHDTYIEESVHVSPRVVIGGNCRIGKLSHIGIGSTIIQGICIGTESLIGAGSVVVRNLEGNSRVMGVPAKRREH
ncbi:MULTISPECIES: acetyltransferase [unclassified Exiguobacterium]|uniref:acetyltransferase n=1 Tax=unclassified Exiguobacterium TaxID=2644629 RepID=UPI001BEC477D|nr:MULTISPECIES: acetyltransferase [unclassified Exiguobacterium]